MNTARRSARSKVRALVPKSSHRADIDFIDQMDCEICFAQGIGLAVVGSATIVGFDHSDISALIETHVHHLQAIRNQAEQAFGVTS